ncbi:Putative fibronectin domain-containing lipoprotein [hydrothermal vent metagenome]|uniref:Putative fibronectin domain-containing lipoprotein n=1 Tax=hydrothermal vent metagenome TaxID=652676 RepID=A0A1W1BZ20_9ZZZZ
MTVISLLLVIGCSTKNLVSYELNPKLPKLNSVKAIASSTSVGFEWKPLKGLDGINIYRTEANKYVGSATKQLIKIATVSNPFATHFVDSGLKQDSAYTYTFRTIKGGYESANGKIINIKTNPALPAVSFFQGVQKAKTVIKLIWRPHPDKRIKMYKIYKSVNGENWKWVSSIHNRMMAEYIDTYVVSGSKHQYRVIAVGFDDSYSKPSKVVTIIAR